jgi:hypothetical protein
MVARVAIVLGTFLVWAAGAAGGPASASAPASARASAPAAAPVGRPAALAEFAPLDIAGVCGMAITEDGQHLIFACQPANRVEVWDARTG